MGRPTFIPAANWSQLPFGWVCFSNGCELAGGWIETAESQLPFGWVCFSNHRRNSPDASAPVVVSIAFRLGLFL